MSPQEWDTFLLADEAEPVDHEVRRERTRKIVYAGLAAVATAGIVGLFTLTRPFLGPDDFEGPGTGAVVVRISSGDSAAQVAETLAKAGVVASAGSFIRVVEDRAKSGSLRPGDYKLAKGMAASVALDRLLDRDARVSRRVTIPEGLRAKEVYVRPLGRLRFPGRRVREGGRAARDARGCRPMPSRSRGSCSRRPTRSSRRAPPRACCGTWPPSSDGSPSASGSTRREGMNTAPGGHHREHRAGRGRS